MTRRVDLPSGAWAELRDPKELRIKHRQMLRAANQAASSGIDKIPTALKNLPRDLSPEARAQAIAAMDTSDLVSNGTITFDEALAIQRVNNVAIACFVARWSYPVPVNLDSVDNMENEEDFAKLSDEVSEGAVRVIRGVNFEPTPDKESDAPFGRSNASSGSSSDRGDDPSTNEPPSSEPSTSFVA